MRFLSPEALMATRELNTIVERVSHHRISKKNYVEQLSTFPLQKSRAHAHTQPEIFQPASASAENIYFHLSFPVETAVWVVEPQYSGNHLKDNITLKLLQCTNASFYLKITREIFTVLDSTS